VPPMTAVSNALNAPIRRNLANMTPPALAVPCPDYTSRSPASQPIQEPVLAGGRELIRA
jgi:hypothetical protein